MDDICYLLIDTDAVSHGLAGLEGSDRCEDAVLRAALRRLTAKAGSARPFLRLAASSETAAVHIEVMCEAPNNTWVIRRGLDGADSVLLAEMHALAERLQSLAERRRALPSVRVVLVGGDHIYAPAVARLRLLRADVTVVQPGCLIAASLYRVANRVERLDRSHLVAPSARRVPPSSGLRDRPLPSPRPRASCSIVRVSVNS